MGKIKLYIMQTKYVLLFSIILYLVLCKENNIPKFVPQGYHLDLFPDVDTGILKGLICINIATYAEPSDFIELDADPAVNIHYKSIRISELQTNENISNQTNFEVTAIERILYNTGTLRINLKQKLKRDITYQVHINFELFLRNDSTSNPFSMQTYFDDLVNTERKFVIMDLTNFGCYKAFPCFNRPDYKSWISLSVVRKPSFYVLSAAPINYTTEMLPNSNLVKDHFLTTLPLSLNSLAMVVSNYRIKNAMQSFCDEFALSDQFDNETLLNSDIVKLVVKDVEERFSVPFPLSAFHVFTVPKSVNIPYINALGLMVHNESSPNEQIKFIENLVHGILSQWFIHIATPVTESSTIHALMFHFKHIIAEKLLLKLKINSSNNISYSQSVFIDLVQTPTNELLTDYCVITKIIPALMFNTLDKVFGIDILNEAVRIFLRKKEFKTYTDDDLWTVINDVTKQKTNIDNLEFQNVKEIFLSWNQFEPLPLVKVIRDYEINSVNLTQEPFIYATNAYDLFTFNETLSNYHPHWIPIVITHPKSYFYNEEMLGWMTTDFQSFKLRSTKSNDFIVVNPSHFGPYVVNYDDHNWRKLVENFNFLPDNMKLQLLVDSVILANSDFLDYSIFLNLSASLIPDIKHLSLWLKYGEIVEKVSNIFYSDLSRKYERFVYYQINKFFTSILKSKSSVLAKDILEKVKKIRNSVACRINHTFCFTPYEYEILMYEARMGKKLPDDLNCEIIRRMPLSDWKILVNSLLYSLQNYSSYDRKRILSFITCTENPPAFETFMNLMFLNFDKFPFTITSQDQLHVIKNLNMRHFRLLLHFVYKNCNLLQERLTRDVWSELMKYTAKCAKSKDDVIELSKFYSKAKCSFENVTRTVGFDVKYLQWLQNKFPPIENLLDNIIDKMRNLQYFNSAETA